MSQSFCLISLLLPLSQFTLQKLKSKLIRSSLGNDSAMIIHANHCREYSLCSHTLLCFLFTFYSSFKFLISIILSFVSLGHLNFITFKILNIKIFQSPKKFGGLSVFIGSIICLVFSHLS